MTLFNQRKSIPHSQNQLILFIPGRFVHRCKRRDVMTACFAIEVYLCCGDDQIYLILKQLRIIQSHHPCLRNTSLNITPNLGLNALTGVTGGHAQMFLVNID